MRTLKEELAAHPGRTIFLGARSSFFFIGPAEEAAADLPLIGSMLRFHAALAGRKATPAKIRKLNLSEDRLKLGERRVLRMYDSYVHGDGGLVVIIEGTEFGTYWTRDEYLEAKDSFLKALDLAQ